MRKKVFQKTRLLEQVCTVEVHNALAWNVMAKAMLEVVPPVLELLKVARYTWRIKFSSEKQAREVAALGVWMVGGLSLRPRHQHHSSTFGEGVDQEIAKESRESHSLEKQIEILAASVKELRNIIFNSSKVYNEHIRSLEVPGPLMQLDIVSFPEPKQAVAKLEPM